MEGKLGLAPRLGGERAVCYAIDAHRKADALEEVIGLDWSGS